jgi:hypothetical protein
MMFQSTHSKLGQRSALAMCCFATLLLVLPLPALAVAAGNERPAAPLLVHNTEQQLLALGCEQIVYTDASALAAARALNWRIIVPADADGTAVMTCPPHAMGSVQPAADGRVAGLTDVLGPVQDAEALGPLAWVAIIVGSAIASEVVGRLAGAPAIQPTHWIGQGAGTAITAVGKAGAEVLYWIFYLVAAVGSVILGWVVKIIVLLLSLGSFITHPVVRAFWPWVLGVANLGFMIALLFIALLTSLRLEIGGGWRRLLPRLLLAALLVNFSLVIAGVILDFSRVVMAVMPVAVGQSIDTLDANIVAAARVVELPVDLRLVNWDGSWAEMVASGVSMVVVWVLVVSLAVVAFGLLVRYVILLLLLVVSPLAYLAIAMPGMGNLAEKWWSMFLRYVIYAPVVLLVLLLVASASGPIAGPLLATGSPIDRVYADLAVAASIVVGAIVAAMAGKISGIAGSAGAIALAKGSGRRLRQAAYRGTTAPARFVGREVAGGARKVGRDFYETGKARVAAGAFGRTPGGKPLGRQLGERVFGKPLTRAQRAEATRATRAATHFAGGPGRAGYVNPRNDQERRFKNVDLSAAQLAKKHVGAALGKQQPREVAAMGQYADRSRLRAMVGNDELIDNLPDEQRVNLQANIQARIEAELDDNDKRQLLEQLNRTIARVEQKRGSSSSVSSSAA